MKYEIKKLNFGLLSPQMIKKLAVVKIDVSEVYDADAYPIERGVMDPKLGVIDPGMRCRTCGGKIGECTGHYGYIELAKPVVNILYIKTIKEFLTYTCHDCSGLLLKEEQLKKLNGKKKSGLTTMKKCQSCGKPQEKIKLVKPYTFYYGKTKLTPVDIREQFEKITNKDAKLLGLKGGRPEWLSLTLLIVPPVTMRPSITLETGDRSEDDLTHKLVDVIRINQRLADNLEIGAPDFIIDDLWELLQYHISTFFNNEISGIPPARHRSGRALKTLAQRLKTKEGRFRNNLTGKRVNYSARTVVSPDPNISINEVGVPEIIAKELTVPIKATSRNLTEMKRFVRNGPDVHPGSNYVIKADGLRRKVMSENKKDLATNLAAGDIVERHMQNADIVLFNRQPSLHRMSIMAHRAKIMPYKTFRLNLCVCKPYNADFDGDEMNMHLPQTAESRAEAEELMLVQENIRTPRYGAPIIGCIQDYISGAYLMTKKGTKISKRDVAQILARAKLYPDFDKEEYTGKELFSFLLPDSLNLRYKANVCQNCDECTEEKCPYDAFVVIEKGLLKKGVIDKKSISAGSGKILHEIDLELGHGEAAKFLDRATKIISEVIMKKGFTISVSDMDLPPAIKTNIDKLMNQKIREVEALIQQYREKKIEVAPGRTMEATLEELIFVKFGEVLNKVQDMVSKELPDTHAVIMAKTGARGSVQNLTYMCGLVGQEAIRGARIFRGYKRRTLPHFKKDDLGATAHGFVASPFKKGLNPVEFFFEVMKGREGIMDSSLKTRVTGYMYRRLVNALQDLKVSKSSAVEDSDGTIIQFTAGEDGIDPSRSDLGKSLSGFAEKLDKLEEVE